MGVSAPEDLPPLEVELIRCIETDTRMLKRRKEVLTGQTLKDLQDVVDELQAFVIEVSAS